MENLKYFSIGLIFSVYAAATIAMDKVEEEPEIPYIDCDLNGSGICCQVINSTGKILNCWTEY
ncbi:MAG: hypothetical protein QNK37_19500 [Acidobacteriota bacterium]|nr:hypothetical protein [Acidobacteriota bacterium]